MFSNITLRLGVPAILKSSAKNLSSVQIYGCPFDIFKILTFSMVHLMSSSKIPVLLLISARV